MKIFMFLPLIISMNFAIEASDLTPNCPKLCRRSGKEKGSSKYTPGCSLLCGSSSEDQYLNDEQEASNQSPGCPKLCRRSSKKKGLLQNTPSCSSLCGSSSGGHRSSEEQDDSPGYSKLSRRSNQREEVSDQPPGYSKLCCLMRKEKGPSFHADDRSSVCNSMKDKRGWSKVDFESLQKYYNEHKELAAFLKNDWQEEKSPNTISGILHNLNLNAKGSKYRINSKGILVDDGLHQKAGVQVIRGSLEY